MVKIEWNLITEQIKSAEESEVIDTYFNQKRAGFFVEAGAWDGVHRSKTLFLERERKWTGILIEPNADAFTVLNNYCSKKLVHFIDEKNKLVIVIKRSSFSEQLLY